jgi:hypothetical protein
MFWFIKKKKTKKKTTNGYDKGMYVMRWCAFWMSDLFMHIRNLLISWLEIETLCFLLSISLTWFINHQILFMAQLYRFACKQERISHIRRLKFSHGACKIWGFSWVFELIDLVWPWIENFNIYEGPNTYKKIVF